MDAAAAWARRQRHAQDRVGAQLALVGRAVQLQQPAVDARLVGDVLAQQVGRDEVDDVLDRGQDALAAVAALVAVAQLDRLVGAGRGTRRDGRPAHRTVVGEDA